jgi:hypothetical protein
MKKITKTQKQIIDAHLSAADSGAWDIDFPSGYPPQLHKETIVQALQEGKTIHALHDYVQEKSDISVTSLLMASADIFGHRSQAYKTKYTRTFKFLLDKLNIR